MASRRRGRLSVGRPAAALLAAALLAGCGSTALTANQLRARAGRICTLATQRTNRITTPAMPSQEASFISRGVAALAPEVTALQRLGAPGDMADDYRDAVDATSSELTALRSTLKGLKAGNDPVVAIKTLQQQLAPAEFKAGIAWSALALPACRGD
jgi:hypothetical protein